MTEGVVRFPSAFGITTGSFPSITETHELVVPKSIPIILLMIIVLIFSRKVKEYATMDFVTGCQSIFSFNVVIASTRLVFR
jgi:hypothetical protein